LTNTGIFQIKKDLIAEGTIHAKKKHIGENKNYKIDNVELSVDGRVCISEKGSKAGGFKDMNHENFQNYLL
jgi:hypothetical protein